MTGPQGTVSSRVPREQPTGVGRLRTAVTMPVSSEPSKIAKSETQQEFPQGMEVVLMQYQTGGEVPRYLVLIPGDNVYGLLREDMLDVVTPLPETTVVRHQGTAPEPEQEESEKLVGVHADLAQKIRSVVNEIAGGHTQKHPTMLELLKVADTLESISIPDLGIKRMDLDEFIMMGFLHEANRQFFHPLGLALEVLHDENGRAVALGGIWDYRDDPEGMFFGEDNLNADKARRVDQLRLSKVDTRVATGKCGPSGIQKVDFRPVVATMSDAPPPPETASNVTENPPEATARNAGDPV